MYVVYNQTFPSSSLEPSPKGFHRSSKDFLSQNLALSCSLVTMLTGKWSSTSMYTAREQLCMVMALPSGTQGTSRNWVGVSNNWILKLRPKFVLAISNLFAERVNANYSNIEVMGMYIFWVDITLHTKSCTQYFGRERTAARL